jgi:hypothetical protein
MKLPAPGCPRSLAFGDRGKQEASASLPRASAPCNGASLPRAFPAPPLPPPQASPPCYHRRVEDPALKWWQVRWGLAGRAISRVAIVSGKIIVPLCLLAAVGYGVIYLLAPWLSSKQMAYSDSRLSIVPVDLPTKVEAPLSSESIDCYGFLLRLPNEVAKTLRGDQYASVLFRNGGILGCQDMSRYPGTLEFVRNETRAQTLLGEEILRSKFNLMQAAMKTTPEQVKWWRLRTSANQRADCLLTTKFLTMLQMAPFHSFTIRPIYTITSGEFRGFQVGNPGVAPYEAQVDLFDAADRHLTFDVTGRDGHGQVLTQTEINAIIASIRPTPNR